MIEQGHRFNRVTAVPDLDALGEDLCVSFPVQPRANATVAWLNDWWWIEHGWNVEIQATRALVIGWLLSRFAVLACPEGPEDGRTLAADRYGGSFGTRHGGSGRCGIAGAFNAKGIGRTPLCPPEARGMHGDGRLSMAEAIREAVAAEVAAAELPWGSVPAVAIIALENDAASGGAILVRPNFVRPAHFERSIFFGSAGVPGSDQHRDALRTHAAIVLADRNPAAISFPGLPVMIERLGEQLGAARAHRLWQGKFLSSNATVTGALVDFGSFRSVPSWRRFFGEPEEQFGAEEAYVARAVQSLAASFAKYTPLATGIERSRLIEAATRGIERGFADAVSAALGLSGEQAAATIRVFQDYFTRQQRARLQVGDRRNWRLPWLYDVLARPSLTRDPSYTAEREVLGSLRAIHTTGSAGARAERVRVASALARWTCPRAALHYETSSRLLSRVAAAIRRAPDRAEMLVGRAIDALLSRTQRHWHGLPAGLVIEGQVRAGGTTALYATQAETGQKLVLLRNSHARRALASACGQTTGTPAGSEWIAASPIGPNAYGGVDVAAGGSRLRVPPPRFRYPLGPRAVQLWGSI